MKKVSVGELKKEIDQNSSIQLVDVREVSEYMAERVEQAVSMPLSHFDQLVFQLDKSRDIYAMCRAGRRAEEFCRRLDSLGYRAHCVEGGLSAWDKQGFPVIRTPGQPWSIERQTRFAAGLIVFLGVLLALTVNWNFIYLAGLLGIGLMFSAVVDFCGMSVLISKLPWNKPRAT